MNTFSPPVLTWLCEELVNALLRPVWLRYVCARETRGGERGETAASSRAFSRFERLVDAADCYPCRVSYGAGGRLCIYVPSGDDWGYDAEDAP